MSAKIYWPRMAAKLTVPIMGSSLERSQEIHHGQDLGLVEVEGGDQTAITFPVRVRKATLEQNNHLHADSLDLECEWKDVGIDPRLIKNAVCDFWMGNAEDGGPFPLDESNLRFIGIGKTVGRSAKSGTGFVVSMKFHDYTSLFLAAKPFPSKGVPDYTQTLDEAWRRICDYTGFYSEDEEKMVSLVAKLRDRIEFRGRLARQPAPLISKGVIARLAKLSAIQAEPKDDAWAVWQRCVGALGLISYIELDKVVVVDSTDYYDVRSAPRMVWGRNVVDAHEECDHDLSDKGVALTSYDPISGTTLEAFYPPPDDKRMAKHKKKVGAKTKKPKGPKDPNAVTNSERYDFFEYGGVTDADQLFEVARRAYNERSRQELKGQITTVDMDTRDSRGKLVDLIGLKANSPIRFEFEDGDLAVIASPNMRASKEDQIAYLMDRGYSPAIADLLVRNMESFTRLDCTFHTSTVRTTLDLGGDDGGTFEIEIEFHNRIEVTGETAEERELNVQELDALDNGVEI